MLYDLLNSHDDLLFHIHQMLKTTIEDQRFVAYAVLESLITQPYTAQKVAEKDEIILFLLDRSFEATKEGNVCFL